MKTRTFIAAGLSVHARIITTTRHLIFRRAWLWTGFLAFATIAFGPQPAEAAVTEAWVHRFSNVVSNSNVTDEAVKVVRDAAGDIIVTGTTAGGFPGADMLTIKYSGADGSVLWQQRYNGPANLGDIPSALAVDGSGNVVVMGSSVTAKYAATDGALLWEKRPGGTAVVVDGSGHVVVIGYADSGYYTAKYAAADGALLWEKRGPGARAVAVDASGNVVVTGYSWGTNDNSDYYTAKYAAADGALLWEKRYNGPANSDEGASAVAVDASGNVVVMGYSYGNDNSDYYTAKYAAADGALLWEKRYNGPANSEDIANAVAVDGSGNVVVTGRSNHDYYTAKYAAADGALLWEKRYNGPANGYDHPSALAVDGSGNVVVTGSSDNGAADYDYYTAKYAAADGVLLWEKRYSGPANSYDSANAVAVDGSGNVVVTGRADATLSLGPIGGDYYTAKYAAADGALLWGQHYNGSAPHPASAQAVAVDGSGNIVVTGVAYNTSYSADGDYYTAKYAAANGALLWEKRYNGPANRDDFAKAVAVDGSGNVVVTGFSTSVGESGDYDYDYYTAKYAAANGALLWEKRYNGPANSEDIANAVAVDGSGNVVVTGSSGPDYYTAKYAAADGALLWEKRDNGGGTAMAVDGSGNVVVTGTSHGTNANDDYYTAKYAAANGALLWEKRYNGPANGDDRASAVAVDGSGNVVVTGHSFSSSTNLDYYTARYAAADGALLWEKRYNGPGSFSSDHAIAVALDGSGNVVVTGNSVGSSTNLDYYTAKYAAANGALLWEKRYNGPANGDDYASTVAVDGSGNVVVTGSSYSSEDYGSGDYYTAMYAAVDGALLWEKRFNGPASVRDLSPSVALGPNGMVAVTGNSNGGYATVVYREVLQPAIEFVPTGVRLRFPGIPDRNYSIQRSPTLTAPWSTLATQLAPLDGLIEYLDTHPPARRAFYRAVQP